MQIGAGILSVITLLLAIVPAIVLFVLVVYTLFLAISALKIYIRKNS